MTFSYFVVYQCSDKIDNVKAPSSCSRYVDSWCEFVCEDGYKMATPTTNMTFQCTSLDWDYLWTFPDLCTGKFHRVKYIGVHGSREGAGGADDSHEISCLIC